MYEIQELEIQHQLLRIMNRVSVLNQINSGELRAQRKTQNYVRVIR